MTTTMSFRYKALDKGGAKRLGSLGAATKQEAFRKIAALGLTPVSIKAQSAAGMTRGKRVKSKDVAHLTYQLGVLVGARIPISDGLMSIAEQEKDARFKQVISDIALRIESGEPLAAALQAHQRVFGDIYIETVRAAERSGNLVKVLEHLSEMLEKSAETGRQVKAAFIYPVCVLFVLAAAVVFLVGVVIPKFAAMFAQRGVKLPALTQTLMVIGNSMQSYWYLYALGAGGAVFGAKWLWRNPKGRIAIDAVLHHVPVLKDLLVGLAVSRFTRVLSVTLGSGLPLMECLELSGRASGRLRMQRDVGVLIDQVKRGGKLSDVFRSCSYLTPFARRMLSAGEESAELTKMSGIVARHYDTETTHLAKNMATVIEPVLVVVIALVVLTLALAIFLPMWDMVNLVK